MTDPFDKAYIRGQDLSTLRLVILIHSPDPREDHLTKLGDLGHEAEAPRAAERALSNCHR